MAAGKSLMLIKPSLGWSAHTTLHGHAERVTCVQFARPQHDAAMRTAALDASNATARRPHAAPLIVSGAADHTVRVWRPAAPWSGALDAETAWTSDVLTGHTAAVLTVSVRVTAAGQMVLASGASDGRICIATGSAADGAEAPCLIQTIAMPRHYAMTLALAGLPSGDAWLLFAGATDRQLHLYTSEHAAVSATATFEHRLALPGHTDWIRSVDTAAMMVGERPALAVATGSQDRFVRLWQLTQQAPPLSSPASIATDLPASGGDAEDAATAQLRRLTDTLETALQTTQSMSTKAFDVQLGGKSWLFHFDSLLACHEGWVHSVQFDPYQHLKAHASGKPPTWPRVLSASADQTCIVWSCGDSEKDAMASDPDKSQTWSSVRAGDMSGKTQGFYGAIWTPDPVEREDRTAAVGSQRFVANNYTGALQPFGWRPSDVAEDLASGHWKALAGLSGHSDAIMGLSWNTASDFFLTTSLDQTTRCWGSTRQSTPADNRADAVTATAQDPAAVARTVSRPRWSEISRPQIHGYNLQCIAPIDRYRFVSGADEKILRTFVMPRTMWHLSRRLCGLQDDAAEDAARLPMEAHVPALGLSNKAMDTSTQPSPESNTDSQPAETGPHGRQDPADAPATLPLEQALHQHSLWAETGKLYGHAFEITAVGSWTRPGIDMAPPTLVSAARASDPAASALLVWQQRDEAQRSENWHIVGRCEGHSLTVVCIRFSLDGMRVLSVGRDRSLLIHQRPAKSSGVEGSVDNASVENQETTVVALWPVALNIPKCHSRIIWGAAWMGNDIVATVSRDKICQLRHAETGALLWRSEVQSQGLTAVDVIRIGVTSHGQQFLMAIGDEAGGIRIFRCSVPGSTGPSPLAVDLVHVVDTSRTHQGAVKCLSFKEHHTSDTSYTLASGGEDGSARIFRIDL
ncbi:WD40 repeat-like protein [Caulochytrium protostelioides]|uniref:Elongator complex protein 2 n=1 Tax=Caulochytrium protostelioides TaxID=1555241 RepID=A0A4P9WY44_9FUNG|nr:WD40 repeat-like protein [Caulochytrium protostelioides]